MKTSSRAQGATEYLVIVAAVVFVALVVITLLSGAPGTASDAKVTQSQTYWGAVGPFSIVEASAVPSDSGTSTPYLKVRNNEAYPLKIISLLGNNNSISTLQNGTVPSCYNLAPGAETLLGASDSCSFTIGSGGSSGTTLGGASSLCTSGSPAGFLVIDNFGFEYQTQSGITKKQYGMPLTIKCSSAVPRVCADPAAAPAAGSYTSAQSVNLSAGTSGSTIYYTTDGSTPSMSSSTYSAPISIPLDTNMTIKAFAAKANYSNSSLLTASYVVSHPLTKMMSGKVYYGTTTTSYMHNVTIYLKQGGVTKYTATTPLAGAADYSFPAVIQGTYDVYFSLPMEPGSVSSTDASNVYWFLGYYGGAPQLSGIQILAIDTYQNSPSINITGDDGAAIQQYYMYGGNWQNSPPPPGNFVFTTSQYGTTSYTISTIPAMPYAAASATPGISSITVTVGASDVTQDFVGACYGDQNLSYLPA